MHSLDKDANIILIGMPGVGKSTCMKAASEAKQLKIINFGDFMFEVAHDMGITDRDLIRKEPLDRQKELQRRAAVKIQRMDNILVDTHCMIKTDRGFFPGLPAWVIQKLEPVTIFLIEAEPTEIIARRHKDGSRFRDRDTEEVIALHQSLNRMAAVSYAALSGASIKIIVNSDGKLEESVKEVLATL